MKTAIIISDTHGNMTGINKIHGILAESDYIIHLGDTSSDGSRIRRDFPDKTILINGNCDPVKLGDDENIIEIEDVRIFATHGHRYGVKTGLKKLLSAAKEADCSIALYGHTHTAKCDEYDGVTLINPGNIYRYSAQNSYCYLVINGKTAVHKLVDIT